MEEEATLAARVSTFIASSTSRLSTTARIDELDGWRAVSILCVIAGHWFPLGPHRFGINAATAASGMALFFSLSGFLITRVLLAGERVPAFLIRRLFRILPLAWSAMLVLIIITGASVQTALSNLSFTSNLPPDHLMPGGEHLWSLCVEVQFYLVAALVVVMLGTRGLWFAPIGAIAVTLARVIDVQPISIVTWYRVDEILAGATLALLIYKTNFHKWVVRLPRWTPIAFMLMLVLSGIDTLALSYARPYLAALTIGTSIFIAPVWLRTLLRSAPARYIASVSFAVYVVHGMLGATWLGSGGTLTKYVKRPLLIGATWLISHLSTFHFENPMIRIGKRLSFRLDVQTASDKKLML